MPGKSPSPWPTPGKPAGLPLPLAQDPTITVFDLNDPNSMKALKAYLFGTAIGLNLVTAGTAQQKLNTLDAVWDAETQSVWLDITGNNPAASQAYKGSTQPSITGMCVVIQTALAHGVQYSPQLDAATQAMIAAYFTPFMNLQCGATPMVASIKPTDNLGASFSTPQPQQGPPPTPTTPADCVAAGGKWDVATSSCTLAPGTNLATATGSTSAGIFIVLGLGVLGLIALVALGEGDTKPKKA
jgi:hypothetical protein